MDLQRLTIDLSKLQKYNLQPADFLLILAYVWKADLDEAAHRMCKMGTARIDLGMVVPFQLSLERFFNAIRDSETDHIPEEELDRLAAKLREVYPSGTNRLGQFWVEGTKLISHRLRMFMLEYGRYPDEDIVEATRKYVQDMEGSPYMRTLKNFIYKDGETGSERSSDLYTYLENKDDDSSAKGDWTARVK